MTSRFGSFELRVDCPRCGQPVPVNAPVEQAHCAACSGDFDLPQKLFAQLLAGLDDALPELRPGEARAESHLVAGVQMHVTMRRAEPSCERCQAPLALEAEAADAAVTLHCPSCGDAWASYPAPGWLRGRVASARQVVASDADAAPGTGAAAPAPNAPRAIALPCPQCGGALHLDADAKRVVACGYCKTDVYIPDDLWRRLHPAKTMAPWFVRFEGPSRADQARLDATAKRKRQAHERSERESLDDAGRREHEREQQAARATHDRQGREADGERARTQAEAVRRASAAAWGAVAAVTALLVAASVWVAQLPTTRRAPRISTSEGQAALLVGFVAVVIATAIAARPVRLANPRADRGTLFMATWFMALFTLAPPPMGTLTGVIFGALRLASVVGLGAPRATDRAPSASGSVSFAGRENYPLGVLHLVAASAWGALLYLLVATP